MSSSREAETLSLQELEELVQRRRSQETAQHMRQIAGAEQALLPRRNQMGWTLERPPRAPYTTPLPGATASSLRTLRYEPLRPVATSDRAARRQQETIYRALEDAPANRQRRRDGVLFAVELAALAVLVAIVGYGALRLRTLNEETRLAQQARLAPLATATATPQATSTQAPQQPTAAPTVVAVLPGGREPQEAATLPASLQGLVTATVVMQVPPTPGPSAPKRLVIEALGIDAPVVEGDSWEDLKRGIGHRLETANPGERGNMVVSAHNDIYGEIFRDLAKLQPGDEVRVYTDDAAYRYVVNTVEIVEPTRVEVMDPTAYPILTMITCYPYLLDTHRVVAVADLAE